MSQAAPPPHEPDVPLFAPATLNALLALAVVIALVIAYRGWQLSAWANRPLELLPSYAVDLNRATVAELELLPGVGKVLAQRIADHRTEHGGFHDVAELRTIQGIGPVLFETLQGQVSVGTYGEASPNPPPVVGAAGGAKLQPGAKVDPNRASAEELALVPGLGKTLAARIVAARQVQRFASADDLRRVKGIGPKTLETIRPFLQLAP